MGRSSKGRAFHDCQTLPRSERIGSANFRARALGSRQGLLFCEALIRYDGGFPHPPHAACGDHRKVSDRFALHHAGTRSAGLLTSAAGRVHGPWKY